MPVGAFGGKREIMNLLAPEGGVYQAGTLSGNPVAVTAGIATLNVLKKSNPYVTLAKKTEDLAGKIKAQAEEHSVELKVNHIGSMLSIFFSGIDVVDYKTATMQNMRLFKKFFRGLVKEGIYFSPSGFETNFLSTAHTTEDIKKTQKVIDMVLRGLRP